jgi:hypothetical protein
LFVSAAASQQKREKRNKNNDRKWIFAAVAGAQTALAITA